MRDATLINPSRLLWVADDVDDFELIERVAAAAAAAGAHRLAESLEADVYDLRALLEYKYDASKHPRWPPGSKDASGKSRGGQFMKVGQRFKLKGKTYEISSVSTVTGEVIAHAASGKYADTESITLGSKPAAGGQGVEVAAKVEDAGVQPVKGGKSGNTAPIISPYVEPASHDPKLKLPAGSPLSAEDWAKFGREDQLNYIEVQKRFGKWSAGKVKDVHHALYNEHSGKVQSLVKQAYQSQYGSSSGSTFSLSGAFNGGATPESQKLYEEARELLRGDLGAALQWDLYNRTHSPDVALFHKGGTSPQEYTSKYIKGDTAIMSGYSQSFKFGANDGFGPNTIATPTAIRHVIMSSYTVQPIPGESHYASEYEISIAERLALDDRSITFQTATMGTSSTNAGNAIRKWLTGITTKPAGGDTIQQIKDVWAGKGSIPIPPEPANIVLDSAHGKKYVEPPAPWQAEAGKLVHTLKYAGGSKEAATMPATAMNLKPGDFMEGLKGTRYAIIHAPGASQGFDLKYVKVNKDGTFNWAKCYDFDGGGTNNYRKLEGNLPVPKAKAETGFTPFTPEQYGALSHGDTKPLSQFKEGDKFKVDGEGWEVTMSSSSAIKVKSLDTGKTASANPLYKAVELVATEDKGTAAAAPESTPSAPEATIPDVVAPEASALAPDPSDPDATDLKVGDVIYSNMAADPPFFEITRIQDGQAHYKQVGGPPTGEPEGNTVVGLSAFTGGTNWKKKPATPSAEAAPATPDYEPGDVVHVQPGKYPAFSALVLAPDEGQHPDSIKLMMLDGQTMTGPKSMVVKSLGKSGAAPPPLEGGFQKGDTFGHGGTKYTVTTVLKNGTVKAKPSGGGPVKTFDNQAFAGFKNAVRPSAWELGAKQKAHSLEPGQLVSFSPTAKRPMLVLGTVGNQTYLRNLDTGEQFKVGKNRSFPVLVQAGSAAPEDKVVADDQKTTPAANPVAAGPELDLGAYVSDGQVKIGDMPKGTLVSSAKGQTYVVDKKLPSGYMNLVNTVTGKPYKSIHPDKTFIKLKPKADVEVPAATAAQGDFVVLGKMDVGDQVKHFGSKAIYQIVKPPQSPEHEATVSLVLADGSLAPPKVALLTHDEATYKLHAKASTIGTDAAPPHPEAGMDSLPPASVGGFQPYASAWGSGGKFPHNKVGDLPEGALFVDKGGKAWKVKAHTADHTVISNGKSNYAVEPNQRVKAGQYVKGGVQDFETPAEDAAAGDFTDQSPAGPPVLAKGIIANTAETAIGDLKTNTKATFQIGGTVYQKFHGKLDDGSIKAKNLETGKIVALDPATVPDGINGHATVGDPAAASGWDKSAYQATNMASFNSLAVGDFFSHKDGVYKKVAAGQMLAVEHPSAAVVGKQLALGNADPDAAIFTKWTPVAASMVPNHGSVTVADLAPGEQFTVGDGYAGAGKAYTVLDEEPWWNDKIDGMVVTVEPVGGGPTETIAATHPPGTVSATVAQPAAIAALPDSDSPLEFANITTPTGQVVHATTFVKATNPDDPLYQGWTDQQLHDTVGGLDASQTNFLWTHAPVNSKLAVLVDMHAQTFADDAEEDDYDYSDAPAESVWKGNASKRSIKDMPMGSLVQTNEGKVYKLHKPTSNGQWVVVKKPHPTIPGHWTHGGTLKAEYAPKQFKPEVPATEVAEPPPAPDALIGKSAGVLKPGDKFLATPTSKAIYTVINVNGDGTIDAETKEGGMNAGVVFEVDDEVYDVPAKPTASPEPAPSESIAEQIKHAPLGGVEPYGSAWGSGGKYKHETVDDLAPNTKVRDKAGTLLTFLGATGTGAGKAALWQREDGSQFTTGTSYTDAKGKTKPVRVRVVS